MKVADLMKTDLAVVNEDISLKYAIIQLADARVRWVPVVDRRGDRLFVASATELLGVISQSNIVRAVANGSL
jgi:CBS domain-containing protein